MKCVLVVVVISFYQVVYGGLLDKLDPILVSHIKTCASLKGISEDQMVALSKLQSPTDTPTQCFLACVAKEMDMMNADNSFALMPVIKTINPFITALSVGKNVDTTQITNTVANKCIGSHASTDKCLAAKNAFDCFVEVVKKNGL